MSELTSVLDAPADVDVDGLRPGGELESTAALAAANRLAATLASAVRAADGKDAHSLDGAVSMKAWLRGSLPLDPPDAAAIVTTGRRLEQLPRSPMRSPPGTSPPRTPEWSPRR